jgi:DNA polymerase-1
MVLAPDENGRAHSVAPDDFLSWVGSLPREAGLAVDSETAGLAWDARVRLVQFGTSDGGFAVPVDAHDDGASTSLIVEALARYSGPLFMHNAPFDIHRLDQCGVDVEYIWPRTLDTHVMAHVINPDRLSFKLKQLARIELDDQSTEAERALKKVMAKRGWTWATVPLLVLCFYGVTDTVLTHGLGTKFSGMLSEKEWEVVRKEMEVRWAMGEVQWKGMRLDQEYALNLHAKFVDKMADDESWFEQFPLEDTVCPRCKGTGTTPSGKRVCGLCEGEQYIRNRKLNNPHADAQIASALRVQGWWPVEFTEKANKPKLNKPVLEALAPTYPLVERLMEYKRIGKWDAAYVQNCLEEADSAGRVHASYNTLGAKTGRMSCSNPPLQQLPKGGGGEIRRLFVAGPGNVITSVDYAAIEMRLAGSLSGEPRIIEVYKHGADIYQQYADELGITRPEAKIFSLATLYGATAARHAEVFGWPMRRAYRIVNEFWRSYPTLSRWNNHVIRMARDGEPILSGWGRVLRPHYPGAAPNAVIQGTAAEVLKDGLLRLWAARLLQYVVAVVHDECVLEVPENEAQALTEAVAAVLEDHSFRIPLLCETKVCGQSWGDAYAEKAA